MHALRRLIQERIDELGEKPAGVAQRAGLAKQTLHSILTDDRPAIREMPARRTVAALATALQLSEDRLLIAAAEAYGVPVTTPLVVPTVTDVSEADLVRELLRRVARREVERGPASDLSLDVSQLDSNSILGLVEVRRTLLAQAAAEITERPKLAAVLDQLALAIEVAVDRAADATD